MLQSKLHNIVTIFSDLRAVAALFSWPKFSLTSYTMVSGLARQGILPKTILDIGANVGQFAVAAAKMYPQSKIHCFEPLPECLPKLRKNVRNLNNISVHPIALGDTTGTVAFHMNEHSHSSSILSLAQAHRDAFPKARELKMLSVPLTTLDRAVETETIECPCLLKIDVQGYESRVLRGGRETLKHTDYVVLESSFKPLYEGEKLFMDIAAMMAELGFLFLRPVGWLTDPTSNEVLQMDALFVRHRK